MDVILSLSYVCDMVVEMKEMKEMTNKLKQSGFLCNNCAATKAGEECDACYGYGCSCPCQRRQYKTAAPTNPGSGPKMNPPGCICRYMHKSDPMCKWEPVGGIEKIKAPLPAGVEDTPQARQRLADWAKGESSREDRITTLVKLLSSYGYLSVKDVTSLADVGNHIRKFLSAPTGTGESESTAKQDTDLHSHVAELQKGSGMHWGLDKEINDMLNENKRLAAAYTELKLEKVEDCRAIEEVRRNLTTAREELAKAAREINCAGPVDHRIRVLKEEHQRDLATTQARITQMVTVLEKHDICPKCFGKFSGQHCFSK